MRLHAFKYNSENLVSRGQNLFGTGAYRLQYKRPRSRVGAYTASDKPLGGRGSGHARLVKIRVATQG